MVVVEVVVVGGGMPACSYKLGFALSPTTVTWSMGGRECVLIKLG